MLHHLTHRFIQVSRVFTHHVGQQGQVNITQQTSQVPVARARLIQLEHHSCLVFVVLHVSSHLSAQRHESPRFLGLFPPADAVQRLITSSHDLHEVLAGP